MDEVFLTIKDEHHYLWQTVDQDGTVLDILVQRRRDKKAAKKFFRKLNPAGDHGHGHGFVRDEGEALLPRLWLMLVST